MRSKRRFSPTRCRSRAGRSHEIMAKIEYAHELDVDLLDWIRVRITTDRGDVINFTVQHETVVGAQRVAVIRYDCAHGFPHVDMLNARGDVLVKEPLPSTLSMKQAVNFGIEDIVENWKAYEQRFYGGSL